MTVYAITDIKKGRTGIAPTYLHTTPISDLNLHAHSRRGIQLLGPVGLRTGDNVERTSDIRATKITHFRRSRPS